MAGGPSKEYLQSVYDYSPCGLLTLSAQGQILHLNQTLRRWLVTDDILLSDLRFSDILSKGGRLYFQLFVEPILRMHGEVNEISLEIETPTGNFDCLFSAAPAPVEAGQSACFNAILYKVINRKKYEVELLNQKVRADTEKENSRNKLRTVAFAQSHLVRAPLANILGLISLMDVSDTNEDLQQIHAMLKESAQNLDTQIRDIVSTVGNNS